MWCRLTQIGKWRDDHIGPEEARCLSPSSITIHSPPLSPSSITILIILILILIILLHPEEAMPLYLVNHNLLPSSPPLDSSLLLINHNPSAPLSLVKGRCHHSSQGGPHHREACHPMVLTGPHHREACQWYHPPRQWYHPPQGPPATHHTRLRLEWGQKLGDLVVHQVAIRFGRNQRTLPPGASGSEV